MLDGHPRMTRRQYGHFPQTAEDVAIGVVIAEDAVTTLAYGWSLVVQVRKTLKAVLSSVSAHLEKAPSSGSDHYEVFTVSQSIAFVEDAEVVCEQEEKCCQGLLAALEKLLKQCPPSISVQVYVWDRRSRVALNSILLQCHYSRSGRSGHITSLFDSQGLWLLPSPPSITLGVQSRFKAKKGQPSMSKHAHQESCSRDEALMHTVSMVCELLPAFQSLVYLPHPGFYDASRVASCTPSSPRVMEPDEIEAAWISGADRSVVQDMLDIKAMTLMASKDWLRSKVDPATLLNTAGTMVSMVREHRMGDPLLQRLSFIKQVRPPCIHFISC